MVADDKGLFDGLPVRTTSARLREMMPEIEREIARGVSHQALVDRMNSAGIAVGLESFRKTLTRWRRSQRDRSDTPSPARVANSNPVRPAQATRIEDKDNLPDEPEAAALSATPTAFDVTMDADAREDFGASYVNRVKPRSFGKRNV